jgi:hypothetical protein
MIPKSPIKNLQTLTKQAPRAWVLTWYYCLDSKQFYWHLPGTNRRPGCICQAQRGRPGCINPGQPKHRRETFLNIICDQRDQELKVLQLLSSGGWEYYYNTPGKIKILLPWYQIEPTKQMLTDYLKP